MQVFPATKNAPPVLSQSTQDRQRAPDGTVPPLFAVGDTDDLSGDNIPVRDNGRNRQKPSPAAGVSAIAAPGCIRRRAALPFTEAGALCGTLFPITISLQGRCEYYYNCFLPDVKLLYGAVYINIEPFHLFIEQAALNTQLLGGGLDVLTVAQQRVPDNGRLIRVKRVRK